MKSGIILVLVILICGILGSSTVFSEEWALYGPRAQAMGGAGVASNDGATAHYWNPAAITDNKKTAAYIPIGTTISVEGDIMAQVSEVVTTMDSLSTQWDTLATQIDDGSGITLNDTQELTDLFVNEIPDIGGEGQGFLLSAASG
ncbi:MAG: hypothetical protein KAI63_07270, partial [Planctomycetes bacterium]|nr:hypothetical protein [Planctomycetota bacterium]